MNRLFAETYAKDQEIEARYDAAELKNDQTAMEQAAPTTSRWRPAFRRRASPSSCSTACMPRP